MSNAEAIRIIRERAPKLRALQKKLRQYREEAGVKPGEPLLGLFREDREETHH